ncbi:MAG: asparagine synthetase B, partial [Chloroflexi bacterium]|nr:asparagine synthetase B [Chloroflexota bacterium]
MCGICGVIAFGPSAEPVDVPMLRGMTNAIVHRGPDSDGFFVADDHRVGLGFRRLSIVDLATGDQPMSNEDDSIWLVFNGEIYNHADHRPVLEARGHRF